MDARWSIRAAIPADLPLMAEAERVCFSDPWSEGMLRDALHNGTGVALVAVGSHGLAGYLLARTIAGEAEILNLAVLPKARRHGVGRSLLRAGLGEVVRRGATKAFLEVRESNVAAQRLYEEAGFRPVGVRTGYYRRPKENAVLLELDCSRLR